MRKHTYLLVTAGLLVSASALLYWLHYLLFRDAHHIWIYLVGDVAFVPLEVLLVVVVIERLLSSREKQAVMDKLNMVVGAFFSEVGTRLLGDLTVAVQAGQEVRQRLAPHPNWEKHDFAKAYEFAQGFTQKLSPSMLDLRALRELLAGKREFLLRLLENPNLLRILLHQGKIPDARESLRRAPDALLGSLLNHGLSP